MLNNKLIKKRINEYKLSIDSLYIEQKNNLNVLIDSNKLHELRSCSKLLVAIAMGIAIEQGLFSLNEKVYNYIEKFIYNENNKEKIKQWTIKTLLTHSTGYSKMIMSQKQILEEDLDKTKLHEYIFNYDIENEPNKEYVYNNVEPFTISILFKEKHNIDIEKYIKENIFDKIDIIDYKWNKYGNYCPGCTGLFLYPKDFHKIGKLILNNGIYNNIQIIPENWIKEMIKLQIKTSNLYNKERLFPKVGAGYYTFISENNYIFRDGSNGQYLILNKEKDLLISIMSSEKEMSKITEIFRDNI